MAEDNRSDTPVSLRSSTLQSLVRTGALRRGGSSATPSSLTPTLAKPKAVSAGPKAKAKAKSRTTFSFTPNVSRSSTGPKPATTPTAETGASAGISVQNLLAHRIAVQSNNADFRPSQARMHTNTQVVSGALQNKMAQYELMRRKKRDTKKSREILELSWPPEERDPDVAIYTPISLPYVVRNAEEASGASHSRKTQRPSIKKVDEENRNAARLFEEDENLDEDVNNWILVQWPSILPALDKELMDEQREKIESQLESDAEKKQKNEQRARDQARKSGLAATLINQMSDKYMPSAFCGLPEGKLGKILIRKSGRAQFVLGEHIFDINAGSDCNFAQEVGCFVEGNSEFFFLGRCLKRMTVTPDVTHLIAATRSM